MPKKTSLLKLNLGCGYDHRAGFVNLDVDPATKPDIIHDLTKPLPFKDGSAKVIVMQDVLEHFTLEHGLTLLSECRRVLEPGGQFQVRVPNVLAIVKKFWWQPDLMMHFLYGNTSHNGIWGAHKVGYTPRLLLLTGWQVGLDLQKCETVDTNWEAVFKASTQPLKVYNLVGKTGINLKTLPWQSGQVVIVSEWWQVIWHRLTATQTGVVWQINHQLPIWLLKTGGRLASLMADVVLCKTQTIAHRLLTQAKTSHLKVQVLT